MKSIRTRIVSTLSALALVLSMLTLLPEGALKALAENNNYATQVTIEVPGFKNASKQENCTVSAAQGFALGGANSTMWYDITDDPEGKFVYTDFDFIGGHKYRLEVVIYAASNYVIGETASVTINASNATVTSFTKINNFTCKITAELECPKTVISNVNISLAEPIIGNKVSNTMTAYKTPGVSVHTGIRSSETLNKGEWYDGMTLMTENDTFEVGKTYTARIKFSLFEGYEFGNSLSVKVNGETATVYNEGGEKFRIYQISYKMPNTVTEMSNIPIIVPAPQPGSYPCNIYGASTTQPGIEIVELKWADSKNSVLTSEATFEEGETYRVVILFKNKNGYKFAPNYTVKINGNTADSVVETESGCKRVEYFFKVTEISNITFNVTKPYPGAHPSNVNSVSTSQPGIEIVNLKWTDNNGIEVPENDVFVNGKKYHAVIEFTPKSGYKLASDFTVKVNNENIFACDRLNNNIWCAECEFTASNSYRLVGDANGDGQITADDAIIVARYAAGYGDYKKKYDWDICDMNRDSYVTADDAIIIARYAAGYGDYRDKYTKYV